jgi:isopenicillin-N epimerase
MPEAVQKARRNVMLAGLGMMAGSLVDNDSLGFIRKAAARTRSDATLAEDEDFWFAVRQAFPLDGRQIILNAGASNPPPRTVHEALLRNLEFINPSPLTNSYRIGQFHSVADRNRQRLAQLINAKPAEIALTRNTTEGMNIAINGLRLSPGDEILTNRYEYYSIQWALQQRAKRDGIVIREVPIELPTKRGADLVPAFAKAIGPRTRAIVVSHVVDGIGQIMPIAEIARLTRSRDIALIVDGAHGLGHIPTDVAALGCDVYATSLHKWLLAPQGTGLLYVREAYLPKIWPMYGVADPELARASKYERVGTRPQAEIGAIGAAIDFLEAIGVERKRARLHHLKRYWADQLAAEPRIRLGASLDPAESCSILQVGIDGIAGGDLSRHLIETKHMFVYGPIKSKGIDGVYVAPNLFTTKAELDTFVAAIRDVLRNGLPAAA